MNSIPKIIPDYITLFLNEVNSEYNTAVQKNSKGHHYKDHVRSNTIYVLWRFTGMIWEVPKWFNVSRESMYYNIYAAQKNPETYNRILQIFIDTCRKYINLNF